MKREFDIDDTVEILWPCAWTGEVGRVVNVHGPNIYVKTWGMSRPHPFVASDLQHSQEKLIQPEHYEP